MLVLIKGIRVLLNFLRFDIGIHRQNGGIMEREITFTIEDDIYDKFCLALNLSKEEEAKAVETCLKWYIAKSFGKVSREFE